MVEKRWAKLLPDARLSIYAAVTLSLLPMMSVSAEPNSTQRVAAESGTAATAPYFAEKRAGEGQSADKPEGAPAAGTAGRTGAAGAAGTAGAAAAAGASGSGDGPAGTSAAATEGTEASDQKTQTKQGININRQLQAAGDCMVDGRYADAADVYKQALTLSPDSVEALAGLGMALGRQNKLDAADEQFDHVLTIDSKNPVAHCGKAMVLLNRFTNSKGHFWKNSRSTS